MVDRPPDLTAPADRAFVARVGMLAVTGSQVLLDLARRDSSVSYDEWVAAMRDCWADLTGGEAVWLWDALARHPGVRERARLLRARPVSVLPAGSRFRLSLKPTVRADAYVEIHETLRMQQGKLGRFECLPVRGELVVPHPPPPRGLRLQASDPDGERRDVRDDEARAFRVTRDRVSVGEDIVAVRIDSLNDAYTRASLRLEPDRRTNVGNIYRHIQWVHDGKHPVASEYQATLATRPDNQARELLIPLSVIRDSVEAGVWATPEGTETASRIESSALPYLPGFEGA